MKLSQLSFGRVFCIILGLGLCVVMSVPAHADLVGVLDLSGRDNDGLGVGESGSNFNSPKTFNQISDLSLDDVTWSDGGFTGVVDISLVATTSGGDQIRRGGKGSFGIVGGTNTLIDEDEGTITLSSIQFTYVSGDALANISSIQFAAVYIGNYAAPETGTLNGQSIIGGNNGGDLIGGRNDLNLFADSVVVDSTNGAFSINGVDLYVTAAVPEPSSLFLFGLVACGLGFRRRKR